MLPAFVALEQLDGRLVARLPKRPPRRSAAEREVMMTAAAREAEAAGATPPFALRPGLIAEVVRFYDQLRRQGQSVMRFEELLRETLERDSEDRGAGRMLEQTRFLAATCRGYERRRVASGRADEHALRDLLIEIAAPDPIRHIVITVGDWIAELDGLYRGDFDLLTRIPALEAIDLVATGELLASGFHQRVHEWLPDIDEIDGRSGVSDPAAPALLAPARSTQMAASCTAIVRKSWPSPDGSRATSRSQDAARSDCRGVQAAASIFTSPHRFSAAPAFRIRHSTRCRSRLSRLRRPSTSRSSASSRSSRATRSWRCCDRPISTSRRKARAGTRAAALDRAPVSGGISASCSGSGSWLPSGMAIGRRCRAGAAIAAADALQPLLEPAPASVSFDDSARS